VAIVVTPTLAEPAPTTVLPESPLAAASDATIATHHRASPPWLLVSVAVLCPVALVGVALIGRWH
jgi:hypothetical protein